MNTLDVLETYSEICNEMDAFMNEENCILRANGTPDAAFIARKSAFALQLQETLDHLKKAEPATAGERATLKELRDRLLQKLLKLLLLSRESEQLLLKNAMPAPRPVAAVLPNAARLKSIYKTALA